MSLNQLIRILFARRVMIILVFGLTVLAAAVVTMMLPRTYQANSTLLINYQGADPVTGTSMPPQLSASYMATQVDVISSKNVALKVVEKLKLDETRYAIEAFKEVTAAQQDAQSYINRANAYAIQLTEKAEGEAAAFDKVYEQYRLSPDVTRRRMYYETMEQILQKVPKTIVEAPGVTPYLPLPEVQRQTQQQQPQQQQQGGGQ